MVLERIVGKSLLDKKPDVALFIGFMFTLVAFATSYVIFSSGMSVAMIGFSSILILPYIMKIMRPESPQYTSVFNKQNPSIKFFAFLFIGMALAYTLLFGMLRPDMRENAFQTQISVIEGRFTGEAAAGMFGLPQVFYEIMFNNLLIVIIAVLLSYFYGSGAIFVLNYNASIAGIVYGSWINVLIWGPPSLWGVSGALHEVYASWLLFLPHTIIEILAYLLAAIAGLAITKPLTRENSRLIRRDSVVLMTLAFALVVIGALVEVSVPII